MREQKRRLLLRSATTVILFLTLSLLAACGSPTPEAASPTNTPAPTQAPSTDTPIPATDTPAPTQAPATDTPIPTEAPATDTPEPATATLAPTEAPATDTPVPTQPVATETPEPAVEDGQDAVQGALQALVQAGSYRVHSVTTTQGQPPVEFTIEVVLPDRFRLISDQYEMIIVGNRVWQNAGGQWMQFPVEVGDLVGGVIGAAEEQVDIQDAEFVGTETLDGVQTRVYRYQSTVGGGAEDLGIEGTVTLWVNASNGRPVRMEVDSQFDGTQSRTVQTIEYDPDITIEPPVS